MMRAFFGIATLLAAAGAQVSEHLPQAFGTVFESKCNRIGCGTDVASRYVDGFCFVATSQKYNTSEDDWGQLNKYCKHFDEYYQGGLAEIDSVGLLKRLVRAKVAEKSDAETKNQYFVGGRQLPKSHCASATNGVCRANGNYPDERKKHLENWKWMDKNGKPIGNVDASLFRLDEPNNKGDLDGVGEYMLALEDRSSGPEPASGAFGLNDVNPLADNYRLLCQYKDFMTCPEGYTMVGMQCLFASNFTDESKWKTYPEALEYCQKSAPGGSLVSIHNDEENKNIALFAQDSSNAYVASGKFVGDDSHMPYIVGLHLSGGRWSWADNSKVDFYRWWASYGLEEYGKNAHHALLRVAVNGERGTAAFAYWTVSKDSVKHPFICQTPISRTANV